MEFHDLLIVFGLVINFTVFMLVIKKFSILENIFMIHWKKVTLGLIFTLSGFFVWFIAEIVEFLSETLYEQLLLICFFLLSLGQIVHLLILHKKVIKSDL